MLCRGRIVHPDAHGRVCIAGQSRAVAEIHRAAFPHIWKPRKARHRNRIAEPLQPVPTADQAQTVALSRIERELTATDRTMRRKPEGTPWGANPFKREKELM